MYSNIGYHGTKISSAQEILREKRYNLSRDDEDLLGDGVYFYEQHIGHAVYYCNIIKNFPKWSILASPIEAEIVIDLMNPDDYNEFEKIARRLENSYKKRRDGRARRLLNAVVLNTIYKLRTYDMARGCFNFPNTNYVPRTNVRLRHIQLCVRNLDCIKSIDEVVTHG